MPICPNCRKDIDYLVQEAREITHTKVSLQGDGTLQYDYEGSESEADETSAEFICPECRFSVADTVDIAESILKGKTKKEGNL